MPWPKLAIDVRTILNDTLPETFTAFQNSHSNSHTVANTLHLKEYQHNDVKQNSKKIKEQVQWIHRVHQSRPAYRIRLSVHSFRLTLLVFHFFSFQISEGKKNCNIHIYMSWLDIRSNWNYAVVLWPYLPIHAIHSNLSLKVSKLSIKLYIVNYNDRYQ